MHSILNTVLAVKVISLVRLIESENLTQFYPTPVNLSTVSFHTVASFFLENPNTNDTILGQRHSLFVIDFTVVPPNYKLVIGQTFSNGYWEAIGRDARFYYPGDAAYLNDTHIVVTDTVNNCLREISLVTSQTARYAGLCGERFRLAEPTNGDRLTTAVFNSPYGIIQHQGKLYVADTGSDALRIIENDTVSILMNIKSPFYMTLVSHFLYVTQHSGVLKVDVNTHNYMQIAGRANIEGFQDRSLESSRFRYPKGIIAINESLLLIADTLNHRIRLIDLEGEQVYSMCTGMIIEKDGSPVLNGAANECQTKKPWSFWKKGSDIIVSGGDERLRKLEFYKIEQGFTDSEIKTTIQTVTSTIELTTLVTNEALPTVYAGSVNYIFIIVLYILL